MNNKTITLGSLFDGSGGFPLGSIICGIEPKWASEIEPFPIRVTSKRMPKVKHIGDITKLNGHKITPVDIISFGSPCQDLSIAGKRNGLSGSRSSLFYEAIRIIKEMREETNGEYPRYIIWENVPGAFSSNKGKDFQSVINEICSIKYKSMSIPLPEKWKRAGLILEDYFSLAWRTFDAQYWGVPQRRKRIYLVADFRGSSASKILFESESLSRYSKSCGIERKATPCDFRGSLKDGSILCLTDQGGERMDITEDITSTLRASSGKTPLVFCNHGQDCRYSGPVDKSDTILSTYGNGGNNQPFVVETPKTCKVRCGKDGGGKGVLIQDDKAATLSCINDQTLFIPKSYQILAKDSGAMLSKNPQSGISEVDCSRCIDTSGSNPACNQGGMCIVQNNQIHNIINSFHVNQRDEVVDLKGISGALMASNNMQMQTFVIDPSYNKNTVFSASKSSFFMRPVINKAETLVACDYKDPPIVNDKNIKTSSYIVRRLTPKECARLQGFPDWWCDELETDKPSEEEIKYWKNIFSNYAKATGKIQKDKSDNQIIKWLNAPHSDSAEYKMWGNGVALVNVVYVLAGIKNYLSNNKESL